MTLDQWLQEATGTFPRGVQERLAQEYTAHLEDSVVAGGSGDALELFGESRQVEKRLQKLYCNQEQLTAVLGQKSRLFWIMLCTALGSLLFNISTSLFYGAGRSILTTAALLYVLAVASQILIWICSRNWTSGFAARFRNQYSVTIFAASNTLNGLLSSSTDLQWGFALALVLFVLPVPFLLADDERVRRTLEIEAASSHQTSSR